MLGRRELGQGRPDRRLASLSWTTVKSARPSSLLRRSICHRTDAALSSRPMARTQSFAGRFSGLADRLRRPRG